jgi:hypothetical protein
MDNHFGLAELPPLDRIDGGARRELRGRPIDALVPLLRAYADVDRSDLREAPAAKVAIAGMAASWWFASRPRAAATTRCSPRFRRATRCALQYAELLAAREASQLACGDWEMGGLICALVRVLADILPVYRLP